MTHFFSHHLFLGYLAISVIIPLFILLAVFICTAAITLPAALIFGLL